MYFLLTVHTDYQLYDTDIVLFSSETCTINCGRRLYFSATSLKVIYKDSETRLFYNMTITTK